jgi:hypothetical protein
MQNEILTPIDVSVSLSKLINELFAPDPVFPHPADLRFHWLVHKLGCY